MSLLVAIAAAAPFALIAIHLARVARQSRALPDQLLTGLFLAFACGTPLRLLASDLVTSGAGNSAAVGWLNNGANLVIGSGIVCLAGFAWRVFRPDSRGARSATIAIGVAIVAVTARALGSDVPAHGSSVWAIAFDAIGGIAFAWAFVECVLYHARLRRRLRIDLADAMVVNRFLLWSVWTGTIAALAVLVVTVRSCLAISGAGEILAIGGDPGARWLTLIAAAKVAVVIAAPIVATSVWLSFSPPKHYGRWLRRRSGQLAS